MIEKPNKEVGVKLTIDQDYTGLLSSVSKLLDQARHAAVRSVNLILTSTYWEVGRRIVEFEQQGTRRAEYGRRLLKRLAKDPTSRFGKGFGYSNLNLIRQFYLTYSHRGPILQTLSGEFIFYHRGLRCFVAIDLKIGKFTHADAGQMNLYLNYLLENEKMENENDPIGLILCSEKDEAVAHYALVRLNNKIFTSRYKLLLPDPEILKREIEAERRRLEMRLQNK